MEDAKVVINSDNKAVVERDLKLMGQTAYQLLNWVKNDSLSEEMKEALPKLIDNYMSAVKKAIGFTGEKTEKEKLMEQSVAEYYQNQIVELQVALAEQTSIASLSALSKMAYQKVDRWWKVEGFQYIKEYSLNQSGVVQLKLGFSLNYFLDRFSDTPITDKKNLKSKIECLKDKGFQLTPKLESDAELYLIDNDLNRLLLLQMIKKAFPSARVWGFENHLKNTNTEEYFVIRSIDVTIRDLKDVEDLNVEDIQFSV